MVKICCAVAGRNLTEKTTVNKRLTLKLKKVEIVWNTCQHMIVHVEQRGSHIFHSGETLTILPALVKLLH